MDAFGLQRHVIADYADYTKSFVRIADDRLRRRVEEEMAAGLLWPEPLLQLNPAFEPGRSIDELVDEGVLHRDCGRIFRAKAHDTHPGLPPSAPTAIDLLAAAADEADEFSGIAEASVLVSNEAPTDS